MVAETCTDCLIVKAEEIQAVRDIYALTQESIDRDVDSIVAWYRLQNHLPQIELDRSWVERIIIINKNSLEKTKERIEMTFSIRDILPEYFINVDLVSEITAAKDWMLYFPMPKLHNFKRLMIYKPKNVNIDKYDYSRYVRSWITIDHYRLRNEYCARDIGILDMKDFHWNHILKSYPTALKKASIILSKVFGWRYEQIHVINTTNLIDKLLSILKICLSPKVAGRIIVHSTLEDLYKYIPKEVLPKDYGGNEKSCDNLSDDFLKTVCSDANMEWYNEFNKLRCDNRKRVGKSFDADYFGLDGSFREIIVD